MAFDQSTLDSIDAALLSLNSGASVAEIETLGKRVKYSQATMSDLLAFRSVVVSAIKMGDETDDTGGCFNKVAFYDPI